MQQDLVGNSEFSTSESIKVLTETDNDVGHDVCSSLDLNIDSNGVIDHLLINETLLNIQSSILINHVVTSELNDTEIYFNTIDYKQPILFVEDHKVLSSEGVTNVFAGKQKIKLLINQAASINHAFTEKAKTKVQVANNLSVNHGISIKTIYKPILNGRFYLNGVINLSGIYTA